VKTCEEVTCVPERIIEADMTEEILMFQLHKEELRYTEFKRDFHIGSVC